MVTGGSTLRAYLSSYTVRSPCPSIGGPWNAPGRSYSSHVPGTPVHPRLRPYHIYRVENIVFINIAYISNVFKSHVSVSQILNISQKSLAEGYPQRS